MCIYIYMYILNIYIYIWGYNWSCLSNKYLVCPKTGYAMLCPNLFFDGEWMNIHWNWRYAFFSDKPRQ